ncbi:MAG: 7-cyano-7-deazaguanine synthase [Gemmatimonadaceae bacterium]|nr:7-cyano-7-deazaguanine synthase [Gemmatimonadaceae bacterium]
MRALVLVSGGLDSMVCLHYYKSLDHTVSALFVDHGQPARRHELVAARHIAKHLAVELRTIEVTGVTVRLGEVMGRNGMLAMLALMSVEPGDQLIALGIHSGSHYRDCTVGFMASMQELYDVYTDGRVRIEAPLLGLTKRNIIDYVEEHNLPFELTRSCDAGDSLPCGTCLSCAERGDR